MADRLLTFDSHQDHERLRQHNIEQTLAILVDINFRAEVIQTATTQINKDIAKLRDSLSQSPASKPDHRPMCPIDLEPIDTEEAEAMPCGHVFHTECIATWLGQSNTCPIDRSTVPSRNEPAYEEQQQQQQEPPYELPADPLQVTTPEALPPSDIADDSRSSPFSSTDQFDWAMTRPFSRNSLTSSPTSETRPPQQSAIQQLAFHRQLITELERLSCRAQMSVNQRIEVDLNRAWIEFLRRRIETLHACMREIEEGLLGEH
ncbi:hypothetical protein KC340_g8780 [Hortaea werneckii]|nr:hypothetical protein KC342_g8746 [Hortaea werneckii]KAI7100031.1 hypothetical protein KC339_g7772 [Hortaea werneckii]KAI7235049.1 hypothetical protein KC365_g5743 [Hortaea werneckii]KAI7315996.1 hypothetical protein KC340_g8780 [Hortaea werneckii]KAI7380121.1 hypothetical protein KC328_g12964 [Hortaea werneckii]